jgi:tRNA (guanine37-N1)-methyltransferase
LDLYLDQKTPKNDKIRDMIIHILTIFPDFFKSMLSESILKRAQEKECVTFNIVNIRDFATDKHQTTDDRPYGGGPGMVMKVEPIAAALKSLGDGGVGRKTILTSAQGQLFTQEKAQEWSDLEEIVIICGHYEGVDERVVEHLIDEEIRIGDYVLTGGEPAAVVMADAVTRLLPGVLGNEESNKDESHSVPGQLGYPQYTRPEDFQGWQVPDVLLQGNHKQISEWRESARKK